MATSFNLPPELLKQIKAKAQSESRSASSMVRILLQKALNG